MQNKEYSVKSVITTALPLIISAFGYTLMITCDRIMLARHDINQMNAVVVIGTLLFTFEWAISSIAVTSEIFAGQFNGLGKKTRTPVATWQMIFMSSFAFLLFIPVGLFGGSYIIPDEFYRDGKEFFKIIMCFLAFAPANSAINGFFIGIKRPVIILKIAVFSNILNIILSYLLIFGIQNILDPMGAKGAAIATSMAITLQFFIALHIFTSKAFDSDYGTRIIVFDKKMLMDCLRLGIPSSIGLVAEMLGNYSMQILIVLFVPQFVSNHAITLNIYVFLTFLLNGMHKATSGLAANLIGASKIYQIDKLLLSAIKIHLVFSIPVFIASIFFGSEIASIYTNDPIIIENTKLTLPWMACVFFLEGIGWITAAIIIAGGDTKFNMYINIFGIWGLRFFPLYYLLSSDISYVSIGWLISTIANIVYVMLFYFRYRSNKWLKLRVS